MRVSRRAIGILSFNRPEYLAEVCQSLKRSLDYANLGFDVYLFQDGIETRSGREPIGTATAVAQAAGVFMSTFPRHTVVDSGFNLGVGLNYARAEEYLLDGGRYESAIFFEDDLVLHKYYIRTLGRMLDAAERDPRIGQVACYGNDHSLSSIDQVNRRDMLTELGHSWGFGVTAEFYRKRAICDAKYLKIIKSIDYAEKDQHQQQIHELHRNMGFNPGVLSQDMFKSMASLYLGGLRLNTVAVLGKYIGRVGTHSTLDTFDAAGFASTNFYPEDAPEPQPNFSLLKDYPSVLARQRKHIDLMNEMALGTNQTQESS